MAQFKVAGALLFCSILSVGPAFAAQTIDIGSDARPGTLFSSAGNPDAASPDTASAIFQRVSLSSMDRLAAPDYRAPGKTPRASLETPPAEVSGSVWLVGAGFGTIFLVAARRRRPDVQGV